MPSWWRQSRTSGRSPYRYVPTSIEPTTVKVSEHDEARPWMRSGVVAADAPVAAPKVCNLGEDCEACQ